MVHDTTAFYLVIRTKVAVAWGCDWDSLDQSATSDKIKQFPDRTGRPIAILREGLTFSQYVVSRASAFRGAIRIEKRGV